MPSLKIGYTRVSTTQQDLTVQLQGLAALVVAQDRGYVDHGLTGTTRERPGLREALAACRAGDTLVVTKLDRLARSVPDARDIVAELIAKGTRLQIAGSVHDPTDPVGRLLFSVLTRRSPRVLRSIRAAMRRARCSSLSRARGCPHRARRTELAGAQ
ncbi:recombinase family protein [Pseudactinotalea sp. HY158]|nr:recombinase family protein [Pseudactinotalea sp. HY158]